MSETILPQVTYSPEGVLEVNVKRDDRFSNIQEQALERLDANEGITVIDDHIVQVAIKDALKPSLVLNGIPKPELASFLDDVGRILGHRTQDEIDRVFAPSWLSSTGFNAGIYPHFQRWLNTQDGSEIEVAEHALLAMAVPFGKKYEKDAAQTVARGRKVVSGGGLFELVMHSNEDFEIHASEETDDAFIEKTGTVRWTWANLTTIGNCACMGVDSQERDRIRIGGQRPTVALYEMSQHNVDIPQQALSLLLGVGSLAYQAAQYEGREDIFADVKWRPGREYPKS